MDVTAKSIFVGAALIMVAWMGRYTIVPINNSSERPFAYQLDRWTGNVWFFRGALYHEATRPDSASAKPDSARAGETALIDRSVLEIIDKHRKKGSADFLSLGVLFLGAVVFGVLLWRPWRTKRRLLKSKLPR